MIDHYDWAGGREAMLRFGPDTGPVVIAALPLFEEANRTRAFMVAICRALAARGIAGVLPDLPGQGESLIPTEEIDCGKLEQAFAAAAACFDKPHILSLRSGALLTRLANGASRYLFAPVDGDQFTQELMRIAKLGGGRESFPIDAPGPPHTIAGNLISRTMLLDLRDASPDRTTPSRLVRPSSDFREADLKIEAAPLWRRAEPDNDPILAQILADDIAAWIAACDG